MIATCNSQGNRHLPGTFPAQQPPYHACSTFCALPSPCHQAFSPAYLTACLLQSSKMNISKNLTSALHSMWPKKSVGEPGTEATPSAAHSAKHSRSKSQPEFELQSWTPSKTSTDRRAAGTVAD